MCNASVTARSTEMPSYLEKYTGYVDEYQNEPISRREWTRRRKAYIAPPIVKAPRDGATVRLLKESHALFLEIAQADIPATLRDKVIAHGLVLEQVTAAATEKAAQRSNRMHAMRAAGKLTRKQSVPGRPRVALRCVDGAGNETIVNGYAAAAALTGYKAKSIAVKLSAFGRAMLGRKAHAESMWLITKVGTEDATLHESCQKPENEADEKTGLS